MQFAILGGCKPEDEREAESSRKEGAEIYYGIQKAARTNAENEGARVS